MTEGRPERADPAVDRTDLVDAGPALRISEQRHPGGPAFHAEFGPGAPIIEGPHEDAASKHPEVRMRAARRDALLGGLAVAALLLVAAISFVSSGAQRGDSLLQALGAVLAAFAVGAALFGAYLARVD